MVFLTSPCAFTPAWASTSTEAATSAFASSVGSFGDQHAGLGAHLAFPQVKDPHLAVGQHGQVPGGDTAERLAPQAEADGAEGTVTTGPCAWFRTAWMTAPGPW